MTTHSGATELGGGATELGGGRGAAAEWVGEPPVGAWRAGSAAVGGATVGAPGAAPGFWSTVAAYSASDSIILWRLRTPVAFMIAIPALLSFTLGPAVAGDTGADAQGRSMIGIAVMFSFITVNYAGLALFREFNNDTWIRQAVTRPAKPAYLLGKLLPTATAGLIQLSIFGVIAFLGYGTPLHGSVLQLYVVAVGLVCVGCTLGGVLHSVTNTTSVFQSLAYVLLIATGCVGGAIVPFDRLPRFSRALGVVTPQHWALRALDASTTGPGSWGPTLQALAIMAGMSLLLAAITLRMLNFGTEKSTL
jgi:ABC-2 type transport system permease protein